MEVSAYRLIKGTSGAILRQGTIERVLHLRRVLVVSLSVSF
jgi:hypothetical protein